MMYDVTRGDDWVLPFFLATGGVRVNLGAATLASKVKTEVDGDLVLEFDVVVTNAAQGEIELVKSAMFTQEAPLGVVAFDVEATIGGIKTTYGVGSKLNVIGDIT